WAGAEVAGHRGRFGPTGSLAGALRSTEGGAMARGETPRPTRENLPVRMRSAGNNGAESGHWSTGPNVGPARARCAGTAKASRGDAAGRVHQDCGIAGHVGEAGSADRRHGDLKPAHPRTSI